MNNSKLKVVLVCIALFFLNNACGKKSPEISWDFTLDDVLGAQQADARRPESIHIDLYLDATKSMQGFAANSFSVYNNFIEELASMAWMGWKNSDVRYYKFGTKIREIDKGAFLDARKKNFYNERGIFEETNIDSVINRTDSARVSVVITDLFQKEGDVNSIVLQIKERCFLRGIQVAIAGIKSDFDGIVFDANVPPYRLKSDAGDENTYRPFYAFIFGDPANLERLFESLKSGSFVREQNFVVISKYLVNNFSVQLRKSRDSRGLNAQSRDGGKFNHFKFVMKEDTHQGRLIADISLTSNPSTPHVLIEKLELVALRKSSRPGEKTQATEEKPTQDFRLASIDGNQTHLKVTLDLTLDEPEGIYSYMLYLRTSSFDGFLTPGWIADFSSDNPTPKNDANKTLNLEKFFTNLMRVSALVYQPRIAKMYVTIKKL